MTPVAGTTGDEAWPADAVEVGVIAGAWGVKGSFKVLPHAADPQALFSSRRWYLRPRAVATATPPTVAAAPAVPPKAAGTPAPHPLPFLLRITQARAQGEAVVASAHDITDRNAAEALRGASVHVSRASFPTPALDEYYWVDLIGLDVVNREGVALGRVDGLIDTGVHSVLRVRPPGEIDRVEAGEGERLIPFVQSYVDAVDLAARRITVDWGLDY